MKKLLVLVFLGLFVYLPAKAAVPDGVYFFQDGKGYDETGTQKFFCFGTTSQTCYTSEGDFAFARELTNKIEELNKKVDELQNTINNLQQPQQQAITGASSLEPAYATEKEVTDAANRLSGGDISKLVSVNSYKPGVFKWGEKPLSGIVGVISWSGYMGQESSPARQYARVLFNGEEILGAKNFPYTFNYSINNAVTTEYHGMAFLENLTPSTTYTYQIVWSEPGREDTIITKSFTTPAE